MNNTLKQPLKERKIFTERIIVAGILVTLIFLLLLSRYFYLQVIKHEHYQVLAEQNKIKHSRIDPTRGLIYDRNGVLLAENITTEFHLYPGLPHAFDLIAPNISLSKRAHQNRVAAILGF